MNNCEECACSHCNNVWCRTRCKTGSGTKCIRKTDKELTQEEFDELEKTGKDLWGECVHCSDKNYRP